ncbi:TPA: hypothetical protein ACWKQC_005396, partial [Escherichia coli]|nr:hypothetical protein [Escherichia coli]
PGCLLELAGIAGFAGSVEYTSEISASIDLMDDSFRSKVGISDSEILKMLEAFIENKFSIKLV